MSALPRVFLVDDHPVVRFGLTMALERAGGFELCGEAADVDSARESIARLRPDLVVLDLVLGGRDGVELVREVGGLHAGARILVFTALPETTYARRIFQAGGHGYLMKDAGAEKVPVALQAIARGEHYASAAVQASVFQDFARRVKDVSEDPLDALGPRELQVLRLLGAGHALGQIARELNLSVKTIGTHRERLKNKFGVESARDLSRVAEKLLQGGKV